MTFPRPVPDDVFIASAMICGEPERFDELVMLSASDGPWDAVRDLPEEVANLLTDDIGNPNPFDGARVQIVDTAVLRKIERHRLFACFRGLHEHWLEHVQTVPAEKIYRELRSELLFLGWDVCAGNSWYPASFGGVFPIKVGTPGTAEFSEEAGALRLNQWALFDALEDAISCCALNDLYVQDDRPWYPVAVCTDQSSYDRLIARM